MHRRRRGEIIVNFVCARDPNRDQATDEHVVVFT